MPCDTSRKRGQTIQERAAEVRKIVDNLGRALASGTVTVKIGPQGAPVFIGLTPQERDDVTDVCAYRRLMISGSSAAKLAIARAEIMAGRKINPLAVAQGVHSHDGGASWHNHKG